MKYRPEIDGLRAIAVVAVVLFHLDVPFVFGGLLGVDVFFVISGYLITKILLETIDNNTFSIAGFYERRARRILPALLVVLIFTSTAAYLILNNNDYQQYNKSVSAVSVFSSNFFFWKSTRGYFAADAKQMPLLHTWSLSVEEQFYVLYPILLFAVKKFFTRRFTRILLLILFLASLAGYCFIGIKDGNEAFYNSLYRCWELLAGGLLAAGIIPPVKKKFTGTLLSAFGIVLMLAGFYCFGMIPYNFIFSISSVIGAVLILYGTQGAGNFVSSILSKGPIVFIGKCSYSLYLWHWPVIVFAALVRLENFSSLQKFLIAVVSLLLAIASYYFVEQPFRKKEGVFTSRKKLLIAAVAALVICGISGLAFSKYANLTQRSPVDRLLADASNDRFWLEMVKNKNRFEQDTITVPVLQIGDERKISSFVIWGDSHAHVLASGVDSVSKTIDNKHGYLLSFPGTPPLLGVEYEPSRVPSDVNVNNRIFNFIRQHPEIKIVVLDARWMAYFLRRNKYAAITNTRVKNYDTADAATTSGLISKKIFKSAMRFTIDELRKLNKKVVIVTPIPETPYTFNKLTIHARFYKKPLNDLGGSVADFEKHTDELNQFFLSLVSTDVQVLNGDQYFRMGDRFILEKNNRLLYRDRDHLSRYGAVEVAKGLMQVGFF